MSRPRFRPGDRVMVTQGSSIPPYSLPATVLRGPHIPDLQRIIVRYDDGQESDQHVSNCHFDSPEWRAWQETYDRYSRTQHELIALCVARGYVYGGPACQHLVAWRRLQILSRELHQNAQAAFAVHPYPRA